MVRTDNVEITHLTFHGVSVDLTHIPALIRFPHVTYMQIPIAMIRSSNGDSVVFRNHVMVNGQYCLRIHPKPGDLEHLKVFDFGAISRNKA